MIAENPYISQRLGWQKLPILGYAIPCNILKHLSLMILLLLFNDFIVADQHIETFV